MPDTVTTVTFKCGERIFSEGDAGFVVFIVRKGVVQISRLESGTEKLIAECGPGNLIGEMAVVSEAYRSATATAVTDCVLTAIPKAEIDRRLLTADPFLKLLLLTAFERLRQHAERSDFYRPRSPTSETPDGQADPS